MALTLEQVQTRLQAAWDAVNVGELSYQHNGNQTVFHSLDMFQRHIDWLRSLEQQLLAEASESSGCPVVRFVEGN